MDERVGPLQTRQREQARYKRIIYLTPVWNTTECYFEGLLECPSLEAVHGQVELLGDAVMVRILPESVMQKVSLSKLA